MARTFKQPGKVIDHTNASGVDIAVGDVVVMGDIVGVALVDIPDTETGSVSIEGVHEVPKATGTAWTQGDSLDWDGAAGAFELDKTTPVAGDVENVGIAAADALSAAALGLVKLTPGTGTAT